jgi:hypothetical protein
MRRTVAARELRVNGSRSAAVACYGSDMMRRFPVVLALIAACGQDRIDVITGGTTNDYNQAALLGAVDKFVAAKRTPQAFGELARTVIALRPGMDRAVSEQAELKLVTLAIAPLQAYANKPIDEQVPALALTVWPVLLAPPVEADEILRKRDPKAADLLPKPDETPPVYLQRLCGGPLGGECKHVVPEYQGDIIAALAIRRGMERARIAVADCVMCGADPGWRDAVTAWETFDRAANATVSETERTADPDNWPIAGSSSEAVDPDLPEAELDRTGQIVIGGQKFSAAARVGALRSLRGTGTMVALHLRPELTLAQVKGVLADVHEAGIQQVAVIAREPYYPWDRRMYTLAYDNGIHAHLRMTDSLQLLLHALDHLGAPGAVARVD